MYKVLKKKLGITVFTRFYVKILSNKFYDHIPLLRDFFSTIKMWLEKITGLHVGLRSTFQKERNISFI